MSRVGILNAMRNAHPTVNYQRAKYRRNCRLIDAIRRSSDEIQHVSDALLLPCSDENKLTARIIAAMRACGMRLFLDQRITRLLFTFCYLRSLPARKQLAFVCSLVVGRES